MSNKYLIKCEHARAAGGAYEKLFTAINGVPPSRKQTYDAAMFGVFATPEQHRLLDLYVKRWHHPWYKIDDDRPTTFEPRDK